MSDEYGLFTLMARIDGMSNQFTKTDWKIVQYMKQNLNEFISLSAQELAKEINTSDASIIRFAQKIGYSGLNELKYVMQKELDKEHSGSSDTDFSTLLNDNKMALDSLYSLTKPKDIMYLCETMRRSRRIFIVGLDSNSSIARIIADKFIVLGLTIIAITSYDTLKCYEQLSASDDLFIIVTLSGGHRELASVLAGFMSNDSSIFLISNYEKSLCSVYADKILLIPKTDQLYSSEIISREILLLQLADIIFQSFVHNE